MRQGSAGDPDGSGSGLIQGYERYCFIGRDFLWEIPPCKIRKAWYNGGINWKWGMAVRRWQIVFVCLCLAFALTACAARTAEITGTTQEPKTTEVTQFTEVTQVSEVANTQEDTQPTEPEPLLYILMYHSVVPDDTQCNDFMVSVSSFREQLQWLADEGFTTVLPSELLSGAPLPEKAVLLTFDDGYRDNYELAFPVLREFGCKAVISVITGSIAEENGGFLTWEMCREMVDSGLVEIGSHTHNLHIMPGIQRLENETQEAYEGRVFPDIEQSIALIEENVGVTPVFLAYPHGIADEWAFDFIHERFPVTVLTWSGYNNVDYGLHNLRRYNIRQTTDLDEFLGDLY